MKEKNVVIVSLLIVIISFFGLYAYFYDESRKEKLFDINPEVTLSIEESPISGILPDYLTLVFENSSSKTYYIGGGRIEVKLDESWHKVPCEEMASVDFAYEIDPNTITRWKYGFAGYPDVLDAGLYRIVIFIAIADYLIAETDYDVESKEFSKVIGEFVIN